MWRSNTDNIVKWEGLTIVNDFLESYIITG